MERIPFNRPPFVPLSLRYLEAAIRSKHHSGDGPYTKSCHALLERILGVKKCLLTTSCTHALELSALLLDLKAGDEVILPSFTFVSTVNAFVLHGATPVFVDVRPDTLNLNEALLAARITPRTRAIVPVHYAGVACEMDPLLDLARRHHIPVVEDNAHGLFGRYRGRYLGTFGALATQSFHETKNFSCGEGGALLINDPAYVARAEIIREKGTNRSRFFRGEIDKYTWVDVGSSYLPTDLLAAFLLAQLERFEEIQATRARLWTAYREQLHDWARAADVTLPTVPGHCDQAYHMFYLLMPSLEARTRLIQHLKARQIDAVFHYQPLHLSDMGRRFGGRPGDCPVTERVADTLVRLPFYAEMTPAEQERVVKAVRECVP